MLIKPFQDTPRTFEKYNGVLEAAVEEDVVEVFRALDFETVEKREAFIKNSLPSHTAKQKKDKYFSIRLSQDSCA